EALPRGLARVSERHVRRRAADLQEGDAARPAAAQPDRLFRPEAPAVGGPDDDHPAGSVALIRSIQFRYLQIAARPCRLHGTSGAEYRRRASSRALPMARPLHRPRSMDFLALAIAVGFFASCLGFVALCERLRG